MCVCVCVSPHRSVLSLVLPFRGKTRLEGHLGKEKNKTIGSGAIPGSSQQPLMRSCKTNGKEQHEDVNIFLHRKGHHLFF